MKTETIFFAGKKVLVTGGAGFIGSHLVDKLVSLGANVTVPVRPSTNIQNIAHHGKNINIMRAELGIFSECAEAVKGQEIVMHLAVNQAGLGFAINNHAPMFYENMQSFLNVIESSRKFDVERMLTTSSACVYPRFCSIPTPESEGFLDEPEPTYSGYGWAKRMAEKLSRWYVEEYGMKIGIARPYNIYGPRDKFDLEIAHVIPVLIKRVEDNENPVVIWGSGKQSRSFLFVTDAVQGLLGVTEKYPVGDPVNIGSDEESTVAYLANEICSIAQKSPQLIFDTNKPEGHPRRKCDTTKAKKVLGFEAKIPLSEGLRKTIDWYRTSKK